VPNQPQTHITQSHTAEEQPHTVDAHPQHAQTKSRRGELVQLVLLLVLVNLFWYFVILPSMKSHFSVVLLISFELGLLYLITNFIQGDNILEKERIFRITNVAEKIKGRTSDNKLKPMRLAFIPREIRPIVQSLNHMIETIEERTKQELDFVASASHELRTPLAGIKLQTQIAQRAGDEPERVAALDKVMKSVNRTESLINQLLILSRLEPDIMKGDFAKVDLVRIAENELAELAPEAMRKRINFGITYGSKGIITGNRESLAVLINNLLRNAINYAPERDGKIELSISAGINKKEIILKVQDNGPGIPKAERERVLQRFYKIQKGNKGGTGLGLSIVKKIADLHNADIKFEDADGGQGLVAKVIFKAA
jgi:signal transduction histidine kinase